MYIFGIIHNGVIPNNAQHVERKRAFFVLFFWLLCVCVSFYRQPGVASRIDTSHVFCFVLFCFREITTCQTASNNFLFLEEILFNVELGSDISLFFFWGGRFFLAE